MAALRDCPVCGTPDPAPSVRRIAIPVFQNVTYATRRAALDATMAEFVLGTCRTCAFSFNAAFDASLVVYDENYDNHVASEAFRQYYRSIATMLLDRFSITSGSVYDVGCGNGEFLEILSDLAPDLQAIGIDPSCTPVERDNFRLIQAHFDPSLFAEDAQLVVLRHVLEHIEKPVAFLSALRDAMPDAPLYVEVPDLDWIVAHDAFWDFCYEHCNYFTPPTLATALEAAGFTVEAQACSFGDQYQWAIARPGARKVPEASDGSEIDRLDAYSGREASKIEAVATLARESDGLVLWGMATKGVLLSNMLPEGNVVGGIDMNPAKQGRFVAGSGTEIHDPDWLRAQPANRIVTVMNPNYTAEIKAIVEQIGATVSVVDV